MADRSMSKLDRSAAARATQRSRLITGMIAVANREGYADTTVSAVIAEAKVSKPTFYEYFQDRDACFIAALADVHARLLGALRAALADREPQDATLTAFRTVLEFARGQPELARFLTNEPLAGRGAILDARAEAIGELAVVVETALADAPPDALAPDIPIGVFVGGLYRLLASHLRRGEQITVSLRDEILAWIRMYEAPLSEHRWHVMCPTAKLERSPHLPTVPLGGPEPLPPGKPTMDDAEVKANQRQRIIYAAASLAERKGYAATTVAEIAKRARVDLRVFYSLFAEKQDVFLAVHELGFQETMSVTAKAYFSADTWQERGWESGRAFTQFLETYPAVGQIGAVEAYGIGPDAGQRVENGYKPFTLFFQEPLQASTQPTVPAPSAIEAMSATYLEIILVQARASRPPKLSAVLPSIVSLCFTPFLGPAETNRFIDEKTNPPKAPALKRAKAK
jgi:AcrR family transcriptional regulator